MLGLVVSGVAWVVSAVGGVRAGLKGWAWGQAGDGLNCAGAKGSDDRRGTNDEEKGDDERIFGLLDCGPFFLPVYFYHLALI